MAKQLDNVSDGRKNGYLRNRRSSQRTYRSIPANWRELPVEERLEFVEALLGGLKPAQNQPTSSRLVRPALWRRVIAGALRFGATIGRKLRRKHR